MGNAKDIKLKIKKRLNAKENINPILRGVITDSLGNQSGSGSPWANQNTRRVWWMPHGATQPAPLQCQKIPTPYLGLKVIAGYAPGNPKMEILSDDPLDRAGNTTGANWTALTTADLQPGGISMLWLQKEAIEPLATWPGTGLSVNINPGIYQYKAVDVSYIGMSDYDLSAYQPAGPNDHRLVGLYFDSSGTLQAIAGSTVGTGTTAPDPAWPADVFRLATVLISDTSTSFNFATDIADWRGLWNDPMARGWPYAHVLRVDLTDPGSDYATIAEAVTAAVDGDCILIGAGVYNGQVYFSNKSLTLIGLGEVTITSANESTLQFDSNLGITYLFNLKLLNTAVGSFAAALWADSSGDFVANNCIFHASGAATDTAGVYGSSSTNILNNCQVLGEGGTNNYGIYGIGASFTLNGGSCGGATQDVYATSDLITKLQDVELVNNLFAVTGTATIIGEYFDANGTRHYVGKKSPTNDDIPGWTTSAWVPKSISAIIHAAANKATLTNADEFGIWDGLSGFLKNVTWSTIKSTLALVFFPILTYARGSIVRGGGADWQAYDAKTTGFVLVGDGTDVNSEAFDWDRMSSGAGSDMVHAHASDAEGGALLGYQTALGFTPENVANKASASGYASLSAGSLVVQNPANATATPTASKIVIADAGGKVDGWVTASSESASGIIELATQAEVNTGTDAVRSVTPATLKSRIETVNAAKVSKLYESDGGGPAVIVDSVGSTYVKPAADYTTAATARQMIVGVSDGSTTYNLAIGYYVQGGTYWNGVLQALANNTGCNLLLNPNGGKVGIGTVAPAAIFAVNGGANIGADTDPGDNNLYIVGNCSALSFTDRTPHYKGDALAELKAIKGGKDGIDHDTLPTFARKDTVLRKEIPPGKEGDEPAFVEEIVPGRDLGAMISMLVVAVQQLTERLEKLEKK